MSVRRRQEEAFILKVLKAAEDSLTLASDITVTSSAKAL